MQAGALALIVGGAERQASLVLALERRGIGAVAVEDTVAAMAALGRARFRALIVLGNDKSAALPLRVLCRVARHRHAGIGVVVMRGPAAVVVDEDPESRLEEVPLDATDDEIAARAVDVMPVDDADASFDDVTSPDLPLPGTAAPLLEGTLAGSAGAGILAGIFAQELTGRLTVADGEARGVLYFAAGEPVAVDEDEEPTARHTGTPGEVLHAHRAKVRRRVVDFIEQDTGAFNFVEDRSFLDVRLLSKVSPFGLILDARRKSTTPASLLDLHAQMAGRYMAAGVGLDRADARLRQFTRDKSIAEALRGDGVTVEHFLADVGLDPLMGTLVVLTLAEARLVTLSDDAPPRTATISLGEIRAAPNPFVLGEQNSALVDNTLPEAMALREQVDRLYVELKPARDPYAVLGVAAGASAADVDAAYRRRMAALNVDADADTGVLARLDELRRKVDQARATLVEEERPAAARLEQLGRYEVLGPLGVGGMAEVFLGRRVGPGDVETRVVIKRIHKELSRSPRIVRMFLEEARIAASLAHPNVVQIYDLGESNGEYYLVMELVDGPNLDSLLQDARRAGISVPIDIAAYVVGEVCAALKAAHTHLDETGRPVPIIHRDVSTHNVLLSSGGQVKLADFGVAKSADALDKTIPGMLKGKAHYLAPEYIRGAPADARTDVFAAGIVLYQCLTGEHPFERATANQAMNAILTMACPPVGLSRGDVPRALEQIVARATAHDVRERFQSAHALHLALDSFCAATGMMGGATHLARFVSSVLAARPSSSEPAEVRSPTPMPSPADTAPGFEDQTLELTWPFAKP